MEEQYTTMTKAVPQGEVVCVPSKPRLYFHPDSETLLAVDSDECHTLEQESNTLNLLLARRMDALQRIETLTSASAALDWTKIVERNRYTAQLKAEYQVLDDVCNQLRSELADLSPADTLPKATLLDENSKKNAIGIMELIEIHGGKRGAKYVYVRSDKIRSHWRRYRLNRDEQKSGGKSFLKTVEYVGEDGQMRTRQKIDPETLKKQVSTLKPSLKLWEAKLLDDRSGVWGQWAREFNDSLKTDGYDGKQMAFDSQAQLMRWAYGAGVKCLLNPFEVDIRTGKRRPISELSGKVSAYANLALAEAKSSGTLYLPDKAGVKICYPLDPQKVPGGGTGVLGTLRFDLTLTLSGSIGASLGIEVGVNMAADRAKGLPMKASLDGVPGTRRVDVSKALEEVKPGAELSVFAGAEASANVSGAVIWKNPDNKGEDKYSTLAKVSLGATVQAGIGGSRVLLFSYQGGKVRIQVSGGVCWGTGGKGAVLFDVDGPAIMTDFMPCLTYMLRNADYLQLMHIMSAETYYGFCAIPLLVGMYGVNRLIDGVERVSEDLLDSLSASWNAKEARVALMERILSTKGDCLKYAPPESKGAAIASLIESNFWDRTVSPASHAETPCEGGTIFSARKRAVLYVLRWVQSKRDYENVMQHLSKKVSEKGDWRQNEQQVAAFLGQGETPRTYGSGGFVPNAANVTIVPSHYAQNLRDIYQSLPDSERTQREIESQLPLQEVQPILMYSCTKLITAMHGA